MPIQWYPGHMTKTKRMMMSQMALVDIVIELLDARIPYSSKNPDIDQMARDKRRIIVLNKADLADPAVTARWEAFYTEHGFKPIPMDSRTNAGVSRLLEAARLLMRDKFERQRERGRLTIPTRAMIVGIPNVGKSTFINRLAGRASAKTGDKPGITRGKQWINIRDDFDLLDTPGVLWPKFEDELVGRKLAMTGAITDDILDVVTLSEHLIAMLVDLDPALLTRRYRIPPYDKQEPRALLEMIGDARGFKLKGGITDNLRAANVLLDEYRAGKLGRITLEHPELTWTSPPQS